MEFPDGVSLAVLMVRSELQEPFPLLDAGLKDAVAFVGNPVTLHCTFGIFPTPLAEMVKVTLDTVPYVAVPT
jgi:hypothetical protein